jgi:hypothetical protein
MADAGAGAHHLHVARLGAARVAEAVLMGHRPLGHIGDDFHVRMGVRRKPGVRSNRIVVPHPNSPPIHPLRVPVIGKREMMPGVEPAMVRSPQVLKGSAFDHLGISGFWRGG